MKNVFFVLMLVILFSCNKSKENNEVEVKSELEIGYEYADLYLEWDAEKVGLLSIIKGIPNKQMNSVLRDYLALKITSEEITLNSTIDIVNEIAKKNNMSKELAASIIFSFQYEMITREEIIEEERENIIEEELENMHLEELEQDLYEEY